MTEKKEGDPGHKEKRGRGGGGCAQQGPSTVFRIRTIRWEKNKGTGTEKRKKGKEARGDSRDHRLKTTLTERPIVIPMVLNGDFSSAKAKRGGGKGQPQWGKTGGRRDLSKRKIWILRGGIEAACVSREDLKKAKSYWEKWGVLGTAKGDKEGEGEKMGK